jgi:hypothetical protein
MEMRRWRWWRRRRRRRRRKIINIKWCDTLKDDPANQRQIHLHNRAAIADVGKGTGVTVAKRRDG